MNYIYKGFEFTTDCEFYKIIAAEIDSAYIKECQGVCQIYYPIELGGISRQMSSFQLIIVELGTKKYRLKSIDPVSLTVIEIRDFGDTIIKNDDYSVSIVSNKLTDDLIHQALTNKLFDEFGVTNEQYHYTEFICYTINRSVNLNTIPEDKSISLIDTKDRYLLDFTHSMYALYDHLEPILKKYGFYLKNLNETEEVSTREVATLQFDDYQKDYFRHYPNWKNELNSYKTQGKLLLNTSSVSKFERLLSEYNSLKFLSNIQRIYLEDSLHRIWFANLAWEAQVDTNSSNKAENDRSEVSYYLGFTFTYEYNVVRNNKYAPIRTLLLNIRNNKDYNK